MQRIVSNEIEINGGEVVDVGLNPPYVVSGLTANTPYTFRIRSVDEISLKSGWSAPLTVSTGAVWTPSNEASAVHQWRAKSIVGATNGMPYNNWTDIIGSVVASGSAPPTYYANSGNPYLEFNGVDQYLEFILSTALTDYTCVVIGEYVSLVDYSCLLSNAYFGKLNLFTFSTNLYIQDGSISIIRPIGSAPTGFVPIFIARNPSLLTFRVLANEGTDNTAGAYPLNTTVRMASRATQADSFGNCRIKEIIFFNADHSATAVFAKLATYIADEHGLTI